jgi:2-polyprenyl-6-methoxyphenol hydroxylase-like FAD-dependent oxidoreductase
MLLGKDGHDVTVLERDPQAPPADADAAWNGWERRGVNQFRLLHYFLPRFRAVAEVELPEVVQEFDAAGALRFNPLHGAPDAMTGGVRPTDSMFESLTARRPVGEAATARAAARIPGVDIRRGVVVEALLTGTPTDAGVPHVVGVRTTDGEEVRADVIVEAGGRRSALPSLLEAIGARAPAEEKDDSGFVYFGRHFRSNDGSTPPPLSGLLTPYKSISILTLPADNGTWSVGLITSARDSALRPLKDVETWMRTVRAYPLAAHWLDGEPIDEHIAVMAKIEDRHRSFVVDGSPVATGVLAVGDAWACTNPSVGRGMSIGLLHAVALRDFLRDAPFDQPDAVARDWHDVTQKTVEPWYRATLSFDRHRLREIEAEIAGETYETDDPSWEITQALQAGAMQDPEVFRAFLRIASLISLPEDILAEDGMFERVVAAGSSWRELQTPGPGREQLLEIVAA